MEIQEIKSRLTLSQVLHYYHLKPDKQLRLNCPFHNDKTPSMQVYYKTHTAFCFSSNCKTNGKSLDVIDFIMHKENCTKREAILKATELATGKLQSTITKQTTKIPMDELPRIAVLTKMFTYFKNGVHNSKPAKEYLESRCLDFTKTEVGYNSGQFHHGKRKDEALIRSCIKYGLLLDLGTKARTGNPAYKPFGKWGIVFPLKNKENQIVSLYFRSTLNNNKNRHFYLRERQGLYPNYPKPTTRRLILTESIIDAATLLEQEKIKNNYEILSLFGTNGLTEEHTKAIQDLTELHEIIFFLNGDQAGIKAVEKYAPMLKADYPNVTISNVAVPENEDVNSLLQGHSGEILISSTSIKDKNGSISGGERIVRGPIASLSCTTKGETYEDNISRSFLIAVDESREQTLKVINYQNQKASGNIDKEQEKRIAQFIQNCMRLLKPYEVINLYATKIKLPKEAHKIRRLNELYQSFVRQITLLNQYNRKRDRQRRLITEKEDLQTACDILFESIVLKVDELDGSLRQFFEKLKTYVKTKEQVFTQREVRQSLHISKAQCSRNVGRLRAMEYITSQYSNNLRRVSYKIDYWDNYAKLRARIKDDLTNQIEQL